MPHIVFTPHLRMHLPLHDGEVAGTTVREALESAAIAEPRLLSYLLDDQGRVRQHVALFVNNEMIRDRQRQSDPLGPADTVYVFQALSGG